MIANLHSPPDTAHVMEMLWSTTIKGTALLGFAGLLTHIFKRWSAAIRHLVWLGALLSFLWLPIISNVTAPWTIQAMPRWTSLAQAPQFSPPGTMEAGMENPALGTAPIAKSSPAESSARPTFLATSAPVGIDFQRLLLRIWMAGVCVVLISMGLGIFQIGVATWSAEVICDPKLASLVSELCARLDMPARVCVRRSHSITIPLTWGFWCPTILLPASSALWSSQRSHIVLLHELSHIKRQDWLTQILTGFVSAVQWFNPFVWMAVRLLKIEREKASDDMVIQTGVGSCDYAEELLKIAVGINRNRLLEMAALPLTRHGGVSERVRSILDRKKSRRVAKSSLVVAMLLLMLFISLPLGVMQPAAIRPKSEFFTDLPSTNGSAALNAGRSLSLSPKDVSGWTVISSGKTASDPRPTEETVATPALGVERAPATAVTPGPAKTKLEEVGDALTARAIKYGTNWFRFRYKRTTVSSKDPQPRIEFDDLIVHGEKWREEASLVEGGPVLEQRWRNGELRSSTLPNILNITNRSEAVSPGAPRFIGTNVTLMNESTMGVFLLPSKPALWDNWLKAEKEGHLPITRQNILGFDCVVISFPSGHRVVLAPKLDWMPLEFLGTKGSQWIRRGDYWFPGRIEKSLSYADFDGQQVETRSVFEVRSVELNPPIPAATKKSLEQEWDALTELTSL